MELRTELPAVKKITLLGLLLAVGLVLNLAESALPVFAVLPGAKLGLANVVTMAALVWLGPVAALILGVVRSVLTGLLSGMVTMGIYGGAGTVLSVAAMWAASRLAGRRIGMPGLSVLGAFFFNVGQLSVFAAVVHSLQLFRYLPVLTLISTVCGLLTGIAAKLVTEKLVMGE